MPALFIKKEPLPCLPLNVQHKTLKPVLFLLNCKAKVLKHHV